MSANLNTLGNYMFIVILWPFLCLDIVTFFAPTKPILLRNPIVLTDL